MALWRDTVKQFERSVYETWSYSDINGTNIIRVKMYEVNRAQSYSNGMISWEVIGYMTLWK